MCWETRNINRTAPLVSDGSVRTLKLVIRNDENSFYAIYHPEYFYELGKEADSGEEIIVKYANNQFLAFCGTADAVGYEINHALHSYMADSVFLHCLPNVDHERELLFIRTVNKPSEFDFTSTCDFFQFRPDFVVLECTIPEGIPYYVNMDGEVASRKLIPIKATGIEEYIIEQNRRKQHVLENKESRKD